MSNSSSHHEKLSLFSASQFHLLKVYSLLNMKGISQSFEKCRNVLTMLLQDCRQDKVQDVSTRY